MIFSIFGCNNKVKDPVFEKFKSQIEAHGLSIDSIDEEGLIHITKGELTLKVSLDNARKGYERDKEEIHITELVNSIVSYSAELPGWEEAKSDVYISLFPNDFDFEDFINSKVTEKFSKIYVQYDNEKLTWISKDDIVKWGISETELDKQATQNIQKLLDNSILRIDTIEGRKLGFFETDDESLKCTLIFSPNVKDYVINDFGFPFYAVIPVRDFCIVFSEKDFDFFAERLGQIVVKEYKESGYPITTEILKLSEQGAEAIGNFTH
jgi:hypothetical protein